MDRVRLGRTGLEVSVACLGTGGHSRLGRAYGASFDDAVRVVRTAIDNGIDFIDTAGTYGTEEVVGEAVKGQRDRLVISTKNQVTRDAVSGQNGEYVAADEFTRMVDGNLSRLGTDYIDIMYLHGVSASQYGYCLSELVPALQRLRQQGKIRHTAISERFVSDPAHVMLESAVKDDAFDVVMVGLNVINQSALGSVLPAARRNDMGVQIMFAVRGKLATAEGARAVVAEAIELGEVDPADVDASDPLGFLVAPGVADSLVEACYRFDRHAPGVDTVVTGTGNVDHLLDNIRSLNRSPLPDESVDRLKRVFGRVRSVTGQ